MYLLHGSRLQNPTGGSSSLFSIAVLRGCCDGARSHAPAQLDYRMNVLEALGVRSSIGVDNVNRPLDLDV